MLVRAGSPRWRTYLLCAYSFAYVACGMACNMVGPTLGDLARRTDVAPSSLGVVFLASIGGTLSVVPTGKLMDRAPGHAVLAAAYLLMALFFACIPAFVRTVPELVVYRGLADVFVAGAVPVENIFLLRSTTIFYALPFSTRIILITRNSFHAAPGPRPT